MPIDIWGITVYEPMTVLTNLLLTVLCLFYFWNQRSFRLNWSMFYLLLGISTFFGAIGHGYSEFQDNPVKLWSRVAAIGAVLFAGLSSTRVLAHIESRRLLQSVIVIQSLFAMLWLLTSNTFFPVKLNSIIGLGLIMSGIHLYRYKKEYNSRDLLIVTGIAINAFAAVVHSFEWSLSPNFTHHDIGHVVLMLGLMVMYQGLKSYAEEQTELIHVTQ